MAMVMVLGVATITPVARGADSTLVMVREGAELAGRPGAGLPIGRFGAPPEPIGPGPRNPTVIDAQRAISEIEAWIAWAWRAGALAMVHGVAAEDTRAAVDEAGKQVLTGCAHAMEMIDTLTANLDREANAADDRDAAAVIHARRVTVPVRAARAMIWIAESRGPDDPSTPRLLALAAGLAGTVDVNRADAALERAVMLAHAAKAAGAAEGLDAALGEADRALGLGDAAPSGATLIELDLLRARLAWLRRENDRAAMFLDALVERTTDPDGARDFGAIMIAQSARARMVLDEGLRSRSPAVRAKAASSAAEIVRSGLDTEKTTEPSPARRRAGVNESLCGIGARLGPQDTWPGAVVGAVTERTLSVPGADIPGTVARLDAWIAHPTSADDPNADEVRLQLARALAMIGDAESAARAAQLASEWVASHESDDRAGPVLALACAAGIEANAAGVMDAARVRVMLERVHEAPFEVPNRDRWRVALAGMAAQDLATLGPRDAIARVEELVTVSRSMDSSRDAQDAAIIAGRSAVFVGARFEHEWDAWAEAGVTGEDVRRVTDSAGAELEARGAGDDARVTRGEGMLVVGAFEEAEHGVDGIEGMETRADALSVLARAGAMRGDGDVALARFGALAGVDAQVALGAAGWVASRAWREIAPEAGMLPEDVRDTERVARLARALAVSASFLGGEAAPVEVLRRAGIASVLACSYAEAAPMLEIAWRANPGDVDVALALADARRGTGDDAGAFSLVYDIATSRESARRFDRAYFRAWVRMVELLGSQNTDGSRSDQIRRETMRLLAMPELRGYQDLRDRTGALARAAGVDVPD